MRERFETFIKKFNDHDERRLLLRLLFSNAVISAQLDGIVASQEGIMADLTALNAAIAQLSTDVDSLIAAGSGSTTDQSAIDAATSAVQAVDANVVAATPPAPAPAPEPSV